MSSLGDFGELLSAFEHELNPHGNILQGRKSAEEFLGKNRTSDPQVAEAALNEGIGFSDFQETTLYHPQGFFEQVVEFTESMPLLPQILSPLFGKVIGELAFANYAGSAGYYVPNPTFLGLGAGRGFLDYDLIKHLTDKGFEFPEYSMHAAAIRDKSNFIVSDRTQKSLEMLASEFSELMRNPMLSRRIQIQKINAADFNLEKTPFGIIYANEILDAMPTEPIVKLDGRLYSVKLVPYDVSGNGEHSLDLDLLKSAFGITGVITKATLEQKLSAGDAGSIRFLPVFVPLQYDGKLFEKISGLQSLSNIDKDDFNGMYPVQMKLDGLFGSIRKSFEHGVVILVDYTSYAHGTHNWNKAINCFRHYQIGKDDIDFQIDTEQVIEKAGNHGIQMGQVWPLDKCIKEFMFLAKTFKMSDIERWANINGEPFSRNSVERMLFNYKFMPETIAKGYDVIILKF